ncbi:hypothetical protein GS907_03085, partial [Rhodococcus hoagii]|nr:hypothetical protein [Prescottella equi]
RRRVPRGDGRVVLSALPDFFGAVDGVTTNGDPIGNIWYTIACFAVAIACVAATFTVPRPTADRDTAPDERPVTNSA